MEATKEERNNILQKAISMYIGELGDLKLSHSQLSFIAIKEKASVNDSYEKEYGSTVDQLKQYSINTVPSENTWIDLVPGLQFKYYTESDEDAKITKQKKNVFKEETFYEFRSKGPNAEKLIDDFIRVLVEIIVSKYLFIKLLLIDCI